MGSKTIDEEERFRRMASALKRGWIMLQDSCPRCGTPLFKKPSGEILCVYCNVPVKIVSSEEEAEEIEIELALRRVRVNLTKYLSHLSDRLGLSKDEDPDILRRMNTAADVLSKVDSMIHKRG